MRATTGYLGLGKATHLFVGGEVVCGTRGGVPTPSYSTTFRVTCKRCARHLAALVVQAEAEAHAQDAAMATPVAPVAPTTRKARRAARRAQARQLRATAPETRAAARARRVRRNGAPAPVRTLLVAAGLSDAMAKRFAPAFSKGVVTWNSETSKRVRTGARRSKRVAVKLMTVQEFGRRLATYKPKDRVAAAEFARVAATTCSMFALAA